VEAVADRVIFIHRGQVIFDGTPPEMKGGRETLDEAFHALTRGDRGKEGACEAARA
jgi:ABC-type Na+ transport system ATPase subunit NatA